MGSVPGAPDEASPAVQARLHVLSATETPWFEGTAAYPEGAVVKTVPADIVANRGRIFWVADPGVTPPNLPPGYHAESTRCAIEACLTIYGAAGGVTVGVSVGAGSESGRS